MIFLPMDGCTITFNALPGGMTPTGVNFTITGAGGTICGYFSLSGAYTGTTATQCGGDYATAAVMARPGYGGSTFTITWHAFFGGFSRSNR